MASYWAYSVAERSALPLPGRPAAEGQRWRPWEEWNGHRRPADLDSYVQQFRARPAAQGTR
jgi:hypothetical protein